MRCDEFRGQLFQFVDGELTGPGERAASAHVAACDECADRARFERSLESRMRSALLSDADGASVEALVAGARSRSVAESGADSDQSPNSGRIVRFPGARAVLAAAAVLLLAVQAAWFFCIPPFECSLLQAVERTTAQAGTMLRPGVDGPPVSDRIDVAPALFGFELEGDPVLLDSTPIRVRAHYRKRDESGDVEFDMVWSDSFEMEPSFRRKRVVNGDTWWVAEENGRQLVAWMCPVTRTLCTLVSELPEESLLEYATELRAGER